MHMCAVDDDVKSMNMGDLHMRAVNDDVKSMNMGDLHMRDLHMRAVDDDVKSMNSYGWSSSWIWVIMCAVHIINDDVKSTNMGDLHMRAVHIMDDDVKTMHIRRKNRMNIWGFCQNCIWSQKQAKSLCLGIVYSYCSCSAGLTWGKVLRSILLWATEQSWLFSCRHTKTVSLWSPVLPTCGREKEREREREREREKRDRYPPSCRHHVVRGGAEASSRVYEVCSECCPRHPPPNSSNLALWRRDAGLSSLYKLCNSENRHFSTYWITTRKHRNYVGITNVMMPYSNKWSCVANKWDGSMKLELFTRVA